MSEGICIIFVERPLPWRDNEWGELPVEIAYEFSSEEKPTRWYPGCGESLEIQSTSIPLTTEEEEKAEKACWADVRKRQKEAQRP